MPKIAFLLFILLDLGPPFYFGFVGGGLLVPLACSVGMAIFAIVTGWRAPVRGIVTSALIGMCFAMALNVPIYFIGRWLGDPTSQPFAFTTTEFIVGLLIIGSAALEWLRRQAQPGSIRRNRSLSSDQRSSLLAGAETPQKMASSDEPTNARRAARGIGGFLLFFAVYALAGSIAGVLIVYSLASKFFGAPPLEGSALDNVMNLSAAVLTGYLGVIFGASVLSKVMTDYPARGIGVAFVTWLLANYLLHFLFFPQYTDFVVYNGIVQSLVAIATAWYVFRLPPFPRRPSEAVAQINPKRPSDQQTKLKTLLNELEGKSSTNSFEAAKPEHGPPGEKAIRENRTKPFYANATRDERQHWFAHTRPWNRIATTVIDAILDGITDKVMLEVFVKASMRIVPVPVEIGAAGAVN
jgi:hypothetical protein